jgi:hypothetical protein
MEPKHCPRCSRFVTGIVCGCFVAQELFSAMPHRPAIVEFYVDMPHLHHHGAPPLANKLTVAALSTTAASTSATPLWRVSS